MRRRTKLLFAGVGAAVLLVLLGTTVMNASAEFVTPTNVDEGGYEGEWVNLEGEVADLEQRDGRLTFAVEDPNASVDVVYDGEMPETMAEGRIVVAKGLVTDGTVEANDLSVRAHDDQSANETDSAGPPADRP